MDLKTRIIIFAYLKNLKAPAQTHFLKHYPFISTYLEIMDAAEQCFDTRMEELSLKNKQLENHPRKYKVC